MTQETTTTPVRRSRPRVAAVVGLTLLEVIRRQDLPAEVLESEDPTVTMPRRLGLSDVVERQIQAYREDVRRSRKHTDEEVQNLVRLVIRRPDSEEVFFRAGRILARKNGSLAPPSQGWRRILPQALSFMLARRKARRRLAKLFGRRIGGFAAGPFTLEARQHILLEADPGGDACAFATGLCEAAVQVYGGTDWRVVHSRCQARGDEICRWTALAEERAVETDGVGDLLLRAEPGPG